MEAIVEARKEYMYMLQECMCPVVMEKFIQMWNESDGWSKIQKFKETMKQIDSWGENTVEIEVEKVQSECDYLDKLIEASIVVRVQIMNSVKIGRHSGKLKLNVPAAIEFVRKVYRFTHKELAKSCEFMKDEDSRDHKLYEAVSRALDLTVRSYVPLQSIISRNLSDEYSFDEPVHEEPIHEEPIDEEPEPEEMDLLIKE
jgi:Family of unknown function (DUF5764)